MRSAEIQHISRYTTATRFRATTANQRPASERASTARRSEASRSLYVSQTGNCCMVRQFECGFNRRALNGESTDGNKIIGAHSHGSRYPHAGGHHETAKGASGCKD